MENVKSNIDKALQDKPMHDVLQDLQKAVENTLKFFERIDKGDLPTTLKGFKLLRDNRELLNSISKVVDAEYERLSKSYIPAMFKELEIDAMKMHGRNFILMPRINWSLKADARPEGLAWLRENGLGNIIREDVNAKTLTSALNALLESDAKSPPQTIMNIHDEEYIQVRKA